MENKKKILIIDDDLNVLNLSSLILTQAGYQVIKATNGSEALSNIEREQPDLIVVDLMLPDMNGAEIIQDARNKYACHAPAVFLTGMITKKEELTKSLDIKIKDTNYTIIAKPFDQDKFVQLVKSQLEQ